MPWWIDAEIWWIVFSEGLLLGEQGRWGYCLTPLAIATPHGLWSSWHWRCSAILSSTSLTVRNYVFFFWNLVCCAFSLRTSPHMKFVVLRKCSTRCPRWFACLVWPQTQTHQVLKRLFAQRCSQPGSLEMRPTLLWMIWSCLGVA
jgi:hypothetical protein